MPKRFRRCFPAEFGTALPGLTGASVHVMLHSGRVLRGTLLDSPTEGTLRVEDTRQHRHEVPLSEVAEVHTDYVAAY